MVNEISMKKSHGIDCTSAQIGYKYWLIQETINELGGANER